MFSPFFILFGEVGKADTPLLEVENRVSWRLKIYSNLPQFYSYDQVGINFDLSLVMNHGIDNIQGFRIVRVHFKNL